MDYTFQFGEVFADFPELLSGAALTLSLSLAAMAIGLLVGTLGALALDSGGRVLRAVVRVYVEAIRNTPFLVQLFLVFFGLPKLGIFSPTISGLVGHSESGTNVYYPTGYWVGEDSYTYWNAGMKLAVDKFFMDFRYWDTTLDDGLADSRFVFSAGVNLLP